MLQIFQETALPKLSQTNLYKVFSQTSDITNNVIYEVSHSKDFIIGPDTLGEILTLIRLNGTPIAKRAVNSYLKGDIVIIFNPETSKIPSTLPYTIIRSKATGIYKAYIFADRFMNKINSSAEYTKLMAIMESAYLSLLFDKDPSMFITNSQFMLTLCNIYTQMVTAPLESSMGVKGDALVKMYIYVIAHFYNMFRGDDISEANIPYKRIISDKIDPIIVSQIIDDVVKSEDKSFHGLLELMVKINPVRYEKLPEKYLASFITNCGSMIIFALEYLPYNFITIASATYKTNGITTYSLNKFVDMMCRKAVVQLTSIVSSLDPQISIIRPDQPIRTTGPYRPKEAA